MQSKKKAAKEKATRCRYFLRTLVFLGGWQSWRLPACRHTAFMPCPYRANPCKACGARRSKRDKLPGEL